jgi:hypothetical protein
MVCDTRNDWVFILCPSSGILKNTTFRKLDLFPSSGERTSVVHWLRLALSNEPNRVGVYHLQPEDGNIYSFRNVVFFRIPNDGQSRKTQPPWVLNILFQSTVNNCSSATGFEPKFFFPKFSELMAFASPRYTTVWADRTHSQVQQTLLIRINWRAVRING